MGQGKAKPREKLLERGGGRGGGCWCACGSRPGSLLGEPEWCFLRGLLVFLRRAGHLFSVRIMVGLSQCDVFVFLYLGMAILQGEGTQISCSYH